MLISCFRLPRTPNCEHGILGTLWSPVLTFAATREAPVHATDSTAPEILHWEGFLVVSKLSSHYLWSNSKHMHQHVETNQINWLVGSVATWIEVTGSKLMFML